MAPGPPSPGGRRGPARPDSFRAPNSPVSATPDPQKRPAFRVSLGCPAPNPRYLAVSGPGQFRRGFDDGPRSPIGLTWRAGNQEQSNASRGWTSVGHRRPDDRRAFRHHALAGQGRATPISNQPRAAIRSHRANHGAADHVNGRASEACATRPISACRRGRTSGSASKTSRRRCHAGVPVAAAAILRFRNDRS